MKVRQISTLFDRGVQCMESGTGTNAVVPFFAHLTLYHFMFSTVRQSTNTQKILAVSMLTAAQSWCLLLVLVMMSESNFCSKQFNFRSNRLLFKTCTISNCYRLGICRIEEHCSCILYFLCQWCAASNEIKSCCC